jgi:hypothetical protein
MTEEALPATQDPLARDALQRAGFRATEMQQRSFLERVVTRQLSRMEVQARPSALHIAGAALSFLGALALWSRGAGEVATAGVVSGAWHMAIGYARLRGRKKRAERTGPDEPRACFRDDDGVLRLRLEDGEQVLFERDADGRERKTLRRFGGALNAFWGLALSGLPAAVFAPIGGVAGTLLTAVGTFFGTALFGRGVASLVTLRPVERFVVTDRRVAVLGAEGAAISVLLEHLRLRPLVVGRDEGRASLAVESRSLPASRPLPAHGLVGLFDLDDKEAREVAGLIMEHRKARLAGREV